MRPVSTDALSETLDYLVLLGRDGIQPQEARARLRLLQARHADTDLHLVWEAEAYDGSVHYDVLMRGAGATVSLSVCPDRALPWPLRGAQRWSDADLLRVDDVVLKVDQAIASIDFIWNEWPIARRLIDVCLMQAEFDREPAVVSDSELQRGMDAFRRTHKLFDAETTQRWMEARGMTHAQMERIVNDNLAIGKLRDRVVGDRVDAYFEAHAADFDEIVVARIELADEDAARRLGRDIAEGRLDFYEAARREVLADHTRGAGRSSPMFAVLQRREVPSGSPLLDATPLAVVGPTRSGEGYAIDQVVSIRSAWLDQATRAEVTKLLFEEWLAERRKSARIEWFWGRASNRGTPHRS